MARSQLTENRIKCVVVGDGTVGKTCMLMSYSRGVFPEEYVPTVFDNYAVTIPIRGDPIDLCIFDTAGQEQYDKLRILTYPKTDIFLVCFSLASPDSLQNVREVWVPEIKSHCPRTPFLLVGNKLDLRNNKREDQQYISENYGKKVAKEVKASRYKECSALTQEGLHDVFNEAILTVVQPPKRRRRAKCELL